ncbi:MAG: hypothetical protein AB1761_18075 [Pseudomonadota bacterium]
MKREVLSALTAARRGALAAQVFVGRCYLHGAESFPRQRATGIRYLSAAAAAGDRAAEQELANSLSLEEVVRHRLVDLLRGAAFAGNAQAQYKLGLWLLTDDRTHEEGERWLRRAAESGLAPARVALAHRLLAAPSARGHDEAVRLLKAEAIAGNEEAWFPLSRAALTAGDLRLFASALRRACERRCALTLDAARLVVEALMLERAGRIDPVLIAAETLRAALEACAENEVPEALLLLGRVLAGLDEDLRERVALPGSRKLGRGIALLLKAADAGLAEALVALADVHELHRSLPSSMRMARYYLERAAERGIDAAVLRLGRMLLAAACTPSDLVRAVEVLHPLALRGHTIAVQLLATLVSKVDGDEQRAQHLLAMIATQNALLAARLALARAFGLTRHEALTLDVIRAQRPWGLWVDPSPFFAQRRKSTPRAVPALTPSAHHAMARAASLFERVDAGPAGAEGDYRARVYALRTTLARVGASEGLFLVRASVRELDALRGGRKWAQRHGAAVPAGPMPGARGSDRRTVDVRTLQELAA